MIKYLITGGAGFIGSCLARRLAKKDNDILILDNTCHIRYYNYNIDLIFLKYIAK